MSIDIKLASASELRAWADTRRGSGSTLQVVLEKKSLLLDEEKKYSGRKLLASEQRAYDKVRDELVSITELYAELEEDQAAVKRGLKDLYGGGNGSRVSVGNEEAVYRPDRHDVSFFKDIVQSRNDPSAAERLRRNQQMEIERRDITTSDPGAAGFIPPAYIADAWAELARPARPFADVVPKWPMPDAGMTVSVPRVQSGATVAVQATQNSAISETDLDSESVTADLVTIAGLNDLSLQSLERSYPGMDRVIFADLLAAHDGELDRQLIVGTAASGQHRGIRSVTGKLSIAYTDSTPTAAELLPKLYDAIQQVASNRYRNADTIVMHPRRAAWLSSNLSSTFPLFQQGQLTQAVGEQQGGFVQSFGGLRVVLDPNVPTTLGAGTNEDEIYVLHIGDLMLMEGNVMSVRFDDVLSANMTVRLRLHSFSFFVPHRQPKSVAVIGGTGNAAPSF